MTKCFTTLCCALSLLLVGCEKTPEDAVMDFYDALYSGDVDALVEMTNPTILASYSYLEVVAWEEAILLARDVADTLGTPDHGISKVQIIEDLAYVTITTEGTPDKTMELVRLGGEWKINFAP